MGRTRYVVEARTKSGWFRDQVFDTRHSAHRRKLEIEDRLPVRIVEEQAPDEGPKTLSRDGMWLLIGALVVTTLFVGAAACIVWMAWGGGK